MAMQDNLLVLYELVEDTTYVVVSTLRADEQELRESPRTIDDWRNMYVASRFHGQYEVVYGSLLHTIDEAVRPIFELGRTSNETFLSLPKEIRERMQEGKISGGTITLTPAEEYKQGLLYRQETQLKDALINSSTYVRTLLEDFDGRGNTQIQLYDYGGNRAGEALFSDVFNTLAHHRYCLVDGEFVHDVFSRGGHLGESAYLGSKMRTTDLFDAIFAFVDRIRVRDFVGVLRGRLENLSAESTSRDIIFAIQNVHSLTQIFRDRLGGKESAGVTTFLNDWFNRQASNPNFELPTTRVGDNYIAHITVLSGTPRMRIKSNLGEKQLVLSVNINGDEESFEYSWSEFLNKLTTHYGNDPLVSHEVLRERFDYMDQLLR